MRMDGEQGSKTEVSLVELVFENLFFWRLASSLSSQTFGRDGWISSYRRLVFGSREKNLG